MSAQDKDEMEELNVEELEQLIAHLPSDEMAANNIHARLHVLEQAVIQNSHAIEQMLKAQQSITYASNPKWHYLLQIQSAGIFIRERKTMKLVAINEKGMDMVKKHSNNNVIHAMSKPGKFFHVAPPLLLLFKLNVLQSNAVKTVSLKVFLPFIGVLMQTTLHVDDDFYWLEVSEIVPSVFDDAFVIDNVASPATMQTIIPTDDKELAYQLYLKASNQRDCKLIAAFIKKNNKFTVEVDELLQHIMTAQ